ncbi:hypothetical protein HDU92_008535 [Lobulomyces angularis]|nr:hypothetical protein HDU92_008535 [Lobulomyces angularis]
MQDPCPAFLQDMLDEDAYLDRDYTYIGEDSSVVIKDEKEESILSAANNNNTLTPSMSASLAPPHNNSRTFTRSKTSPSFSGSDTGSFINELAVNTAISSQEIKKASSIKTGLTARLNFATTMPKNMTRFIMRLGPLVAIQDDLIEIFTWKNPYRTVAIMLVYIILCLYPTLFLIVPQTAFIYYLIKQYYRKTKHIAMNKKETKINVNLQYLKNLQFIQNHMGAFADGYDEISRFNRNILTWNDEDETMKVLKIAIASIFGVVIFLRLVPTSWIFLGGGVFLFLQHTALFRAASATLPPVLMRNLQYRVDFVREAILNVTKAGTTGKTTVQLYENQRWWAGLGWIAHLLRSERVAWSDESGENAKPSKDDYELPGVEWEWASDDWKIDMAWNSTMDENGWVYSDHNWLNIQNKPGVTSLTRRRMWVRTMQLKKIA